MIEPDSDADRQAGMDEMSAKFKEMGNKLYLDAEQAETSKPS